MRIENVVMVQQKGLSIYWFDAFIRSFLAYRNYYIMSKRQLLK